MCLRPVPLLALFFPLPVFYSLYCSLPLIMSAYGGTAYGPDGCDAAHETSDCRSAHTNVLISLPALSELLLQAGQQHPCCLEKMVQSYVGNS